MSLIIVVMRLCAAPSGNINN